MLKHLYIKDFILIKELELDFIEGFSVFTGETGAGKSILIDAISFLCGNRADSSVISKGSNKTILEAVFLVNNPKVKEMLEEVEIDFDGELIVSRIISSNNKSSVKINHRTTTLTFLKELMTNVVDLAAQHQAQYLMNKRNHLLLLDNFCMSDSQYLNLKSKVSIAFKNYNQFCLELKQFEEINLSETEIDFLNFQIEEILKYDFNYGEEDDLVAREKEIAAFKKSYDSINNALSLLKYEGSIIGNLYEVNSLLSMSDNQEVIKLSSKFLDHYEEINDLSEELTDFIDNFDLDENELDRISSRLFDINKMKRKYHVTSLNQLLDKLATFQDTISKIETQANIKVDLENKINKSLKIYNVEAEKLSLYRQNKSLKLEKMIVNELNDLKLNNARFKVKFTRSTVTSNGFDNVEFLIATNSSSDLQSLTKIASGGELSRLMLGLKVIFTKLSKVETIIFDEVDTGVSGQVSTRIGLKMAKLAQSSQVFAVTHLATVASCANNHYYISKASNNNITESITKRLTKEEIIRELASITYGNVNELALKSAEKMYEENQRLAYDKN